MADMTLTIRADVHFVTRPVPKFARKIPLAFLPESFRVSKTLRVRAIGESWTDMDERTDLVPNEHAERMTMDLPPEQAEGIRTFFRRYYVQRNGIEWSPCGLLCAIFNAPTMRRDENAEPVSVRDLKPGTGYTINYPGTPNPRAFFYTLRDDFNQGKCMSLTGANSELVIVTSKAYYDGHGGGDIYELTPSTREDAPKGSIFYIPHEYRLEGR